MNFDFSLIPGKTLKERKQILESFAQEITIITPFYNTRKELILGTAFSILNQTYPYFEWLIIDDGSTNKESLETLKEIEKIDDRIKVFHKQNEGLAQTRDYGAKKASESSKYLLFIDDDDLISPTYVECAYWTLQTNKEASWCYSDSVGFGAQEYIWRKWYNPIRQKKENRLVSINFIRKNDFFEAGGYELKVKSVYEDWNFWLKLIAREKYPVRMSNIDLWYRRKAKNDGELAKATANHEKAMAYIEKTASTITKVKKGVQYPKQDYNWDIIFDEVESIKIPNLKQSQKIQILMIVPWMITGGADKFNLDLVKNINKDKFEITIVSTLPNTNELKQQFEQYATVYDLTAFLDRKHWLSFINYLIQKNKINLIFNTCSQFGYNVLPYLKGKYPNIPIVDYVHMEEWYWRNGGYSRDSYAFKDVIDKTLVCNKNSENILINHFGKKKEEVQTVYIGVDENSFNPDKYKKDEILSKLNISKENKFIISYICRISEQKRPFLLLEIIKKLKEKRNDFSVVVAGDGPLLDIMKKKASKYRIIDNMVFLGNCTNTQEIYAISDLTLNCSIKEGVALTSYESLAMGVPVISSNVGGQSELIDDSVGKVVKCYQTEKEIKNFKYKDEEVKEYVSAIEAIVNNLEKYKSSCRNRIIEKFTINKMVSNMENIFEKVTQNPNTEKIKAGNALSNCLDLTKEYIASYLMLSDGEYKWLTDEFNRKNIDEVDYKYNTEDPKRAYYEQTTEYKIKHFIVIVLQKIGIYNVIKRILRKE